MPEESEQSWWKRPTVLISIASLVVSVAVLLLGGGFVWNRWVDVPDVVYSVLPTYSMEGQSFSGIVVENRGRRTAHEVLMQTGDLGSTVQQYSVDTYELWTERGGAIGHSAVTLSVERMVSGSRLTLYVLTSGVPDYSRTRLTADEGAGRPAPRTDESGRTMVIANVIIVSFTMVAMLVMNAVSRRMMFRR